MGHCPHWIGSGRVPRIRGGSLSTGPVSPRSGREIKGSRALLPAAERLLPRVRRVIPPQLCLLIQLRAPPWTAALSGGPGCEEATASREHRVRGAERWLGKRQRSCQATLSPRAPRAEGQARPVTQVWGRLLVLELSPALTGCTVGHYRSRWEVQRGHRRWGLTWSHT